MVKTLRFVMVFVVSGVLVGAVLLPLGVSAVGEINVDTTIDDLDTEGNGFCSLREAIENANNNDQGYPDCEPGGLLTVDVINLPTGTYTLELGGPGEDGNQEGDLDITDDLVINGLISDLDVPIIQAGTSSPVLGDCPDCIDRVLHIHTGISVEINDVVVRYGKTPDALEGTASNTEQYGGGIMNQGNLVLNNCLVSDNRTGDGGDYPNGNAGHGGFGGGIYNDGILTLNRSVVNNNYTGKGGDSLVGGNGGYGGFGGGIYAEYLSTLTFVDSQISMNRTGIGGNGGDDSVSNAGNGGTGGRAGGVYCDDCTLVVETSVIEENTTGNGGDGGNATDGDWYGGNGGRGGYGGGFYSNTDFTMAFTDTTISDNYTGNGGLGGDGFGSGADGSDGFQGSGGGIYITGGTYSIYCSTIDHNDGFVGGGISVASDSILQVTNSTVSNNQSDETGGGVYASGSSSVNLLHTTIAFNTADADGDGSGNGGGIAKSTGAVTLTNIILAKNSDGDDSNPDCSGNLTSGDYNWVGIADSVGCGLIAQPNDQFGTEASPYDITLAVLGDYGGPTETHLVQYPHDSINAIPMGTNGCGTTVILDQRGVLRFDGCDIGAVEYNLVEKIYLPVVMK